MKTLIVLFGLLGCALCAPIQPTARQIFFDPIRSQYHAQDLFGQYSYGYNDGLNAKSEVKTADGITRGFYRLLQADGQPHTIAYIADPIHGYRINSGIPFVQDTPEVARAKAAHMEAWNTAKLESERSGMWQEMMNEKMDKFKSEEMMYKEKLEKKDMFKKEEMLDNKEMWEKKDMLEKKSDSLKWTQLPEPVKDTPEVELAKREHFRAHEIANARLQLENAKGTPLIYTSLVGTVYGGEPVLTSLRSFGQVSTKPSFKFNNPVGVSSHNSPVVITTVPIQTFTGEQKSGEKDRSFESVFGSHTGNLGNFVGPVVKVITPVGSVAAADNIPFPVVHRTTV